MCVCVCVCVCVCENVHHVCHDLLFILQQGPAKESQTGGPYSPMIWTYRYGMEFHTLYMYVSWKNSREEAKCRGPN